MTQRSSFQRFIGELRRRRVGRTAAVYLVAAWAAIEFADVVVPNLNGPSWVVTAVIVASGVGLPVVLVLAWIFDWGPEGLHRTPDAPPSPTDPERAGVGTTGVATDSGGRGATAPWMAAVAVLVVAIASGVAVAALLESSGDGEPRSEPRTPPELVARDGFPHPDSIRNQMLGALEEGGLGDLSRLGDLAERRPSGAADSMALREILSAAATQAGLSILLHEPDEWMIGRGGPVELPAGDTLVVRGLARDTAGVASVTVDGAVVVESDDPRTNVRFTGRVVGTESSGRRQVTIVVRTADGREIRRQYTVTGVPAN